MLYDPCIPSPNPRAPPFYITNPLPLQDTIVKLDPAVSMANKSPSRPSFEIIVCRGFEEETGPLAHPHTCTKAAPFISRAALFDLSTSLNQCIVRTQVYLSEIHLIPNSYPIL